MPVPRLRAALAAIAAAVTIGAALPAPASADWVVKGRGFGHLIGMSQYGAYGYAKHGFGYRQILAHYYTGTDIGSASKRVVRVLVGTSGSDASFKHASSACGRDLNPGHTYRAHRRGGRVRLQSNHGKPLADCGSKLHADAAGSFINILGAGKFRGGFEAVPNGGGLNLVNALGIDDYAQGVVPHEVPASWPMAALRVQAVAARSYALTSSVNGNGFDLYSDTSSQAYGGLKLETPQTNQAVQSTAGEVVTYKGKIAQTFYFSCSGGMTENVENIFYGPSIPYLKGVTDPYDGDCPLHRWTRPFSPSELGGYFSGRFKGLKVLKAGVSGAVVWGRVIGSRSSSKIRGDALESAVGGYSPWIRIKRR